MSDICRAAVSVMTEDVILGLCPACGHSLLLHAGTDVCPVCVLERLPDTLRTFDQRIAKLERDEGIRLL